MTPMDETWISDDPKNMELDPEATVLPGKAFLDGSEQDRLYRPGDTIAGSFVVNSALSAAGKQADVYLARKAGHACVVKMYHTGWQPSDRMHGLLLNIRHSNLANLMDCGQHDGRYFEIYEYYSEGTLEQKKQCSPAFIQSVVIPSVNEGLRALHENGIVHCDIKPSNLFLHQDGASVVIGDFGISGYAGAKGAFIDTIRGTPEYAPRIVTSLGLATIPPSYDYGSLGLVLIRLIMGRSLFTGMSHAEIAAQWEHGIVLPSQINGRMLQLVRGLLQEDRSLVWGYQQVKRWCEGEFIRTTHLPGYQKPDPVAHPVRPLVFGRFGGQTVVVSTLHQLSSEIRAHWEHAAKLLKRRELGDFIQQFDPDLAQDARNLETLRDGDAAAFRLLQIIGKPDTIFYCGKDMGTVNEFLDMLSAHNDPVAVRFVLSGLFTWFLRQHGANNKEIDTLERIVSRDGLSDMAAIRALCYALRQKKPLTIGSRTFDDLNGFVDAIAAMTTAQISDLLENDNVTAWLYSIGLKGEIAKLAALQEESP